MLRPAPGDFGIASTGPLYRGGCATLTPCPTDRTHLRAAYADDWNLGGRVDQGRLTVP